MWNKYPYTDVHELNLDWIIFKVKQLETWRKNVVDPFIERITIWKDEVVDPFIADITDWKNNVVDPTLENHEDRITNLEFDVDNLEDRMDLAELDIDNLEIRMNTAERDIETLEGRLDEAIDDINDNFDTINQSIDDIADDIEALETSKQDKLTAGTNITIDENNVISASGSIVGTVAWNDVTSKPFNSIGTNLKVNNNVLDVPNAGSTNAGVIKTYWDSTTSTLYITDNGNSPIPV